MKAIVNEKYGSPDVMALKELKRPEPKSNQVLIKVLAASVNKADWHILNGSPFPIRLMAGMFKPKYQTLGADVAGIVERVGADVTQFKPGDEIYGDLSGSGFGAFAEYALTDEARIARKPSNLSYEETAALPMAAITALQGLRDKGEIGAGCQVLINGASGGVGGYAVQLAKAFGAEVTAVCSTNKLKQAKSIGADEVIDYRNQDFTKLDKKYDLIFDVVGNHQLSAISSALKNGGRYVTCAFNPAIAFSGMWFGLTRKQRMINLLASCNQADLQFVTRLVEESRLKPFIQEAFTLDDVPEALRQMGKGGLSGKLVISI